MAIFNSVPSGISSIKSGLFAKLMFGTLSNMPDFIPSDTSGFNETNSSSEMSNFLVIL